METKHITTAATLKTAGSDAGSIEAAFVRFHNRDLDGDVILPTAFKDGQEVIMTWAHQWEHPIGKGVVRVEPDRAVFSGRLWLDTFDGEQAYKRIKNAGKLQQYSWGFQITDSNRGDFRGEPSRFIAGTELFEVSPVLIGAAGPGNTATLAIKHGRRDQRVTLTEHDVLVTQARLNGVYVPYAKSSPLYSPEDEIRCVVMEARETLARCDRAMGR